MAVRHVQLSPEAEPSLDSVAASFDGDAGLALSQLLIAHELIGSFLDEPESSNAEELMRQCDRLTREFREPQRKDQDVSTGLIVAYGDSITDGAKSAMDLNHRWPDILANRLITLKGPNRFAVVDAGIGGNKIISDATGRNIAYGVNGLARLERDALAQAGVRYLLLLEGIDDLSSNASTEDLMAGMKQIVERCHENGIKAIGGTITPAERVGARANGLSDRETRRLALNDWIRNGRAFDGFVDFGKAVEDPAQPGVMAAAFDSGDHPHPNDAGYTAMGEAVDLTLFQ